jgi:hypothetical protein
MTRVPELLDKLQIVEEFYQKETSNVPKAIFDMIAIQRELLVEAKNEFGENIPPDRFEGYEMPEALTKPF